jgi:hypothetical protein
MGKASGHALATLLTTRKKETRMPVREPFSFSGSFKMFDDDNDVMKFALPCRALFDLKMMMMMIPAVLN